MSYEFTDDEIKEIITAARIFSQDFNEERFQALRKLEKRLADSSFLETVRGLVRMEEEMDVPINEVLDAFEKLLSDRDRVSAEVAGLRGKLVELQGREPRRRKPGIGSNKPLLSRPEGNYRRSRSGGRRRRRSSPLSRRRLRGKRHGLTKRSKNIGKRRM